jgi:hypothetical protein
MCSHAKGCCVKPTKDDVSPNPRLVLKGKEVDVLQVKPNENNLHINANC